MVNRSVQINENPVNDRKIFVKDSRNPVKNSKIPVRNSINPVKNSNNFVRNSINPVRNSKNPVKNSQELVRKQRNNVRLFLFVRSIFLLRKRSFKILPVHPGNMFQGDGFRTLYFAGLCAGTAAKSQFVCLSQHIKGPLFGFRLPLR